MSAFDFAVLGFPKCGTTALVRLLAKQPDIHLDEWNGSPEAPLFHNTANVEKYGKKLENSSAIARGHKFTAYIYSTSALSHLYKENPQAVYVVCVRNSLRALISWREMHRSIASAGQPASHFTNKDARTRDFYINASIDDYYYSFARDRLRYEFYIRRAINAMPLSHFIITSQEYLARNPNGVLDVLSAQLGVVNTGINVDREYRAYADGLETKLIIGDDVRRELDSEVKRLKTFLDSTTNDPQVKVLV